jgi:hypothetical protein
MMQRDAIKLHVGCETQRQPATDLGQSSSAIQMHPFLYTNGAPLTGTSQHNRINIALIAAPIQRSDAGEKSTGLILVAKKVSEKCVENKLTTHHLPSEVMAAHQANVPVWRTRQLDPGIQTRAPHLHIESASTADNTPRYYRCPTVDTLHEYMCSTLVAAHSLFTAPPVWDPVNGKF